MSNAEKRIAIVVGINEYEAGQEQIPKLNGAENDAIEIRDRLIKYGNFEISNNHYLVGPDATRRNILRAVGEAFQQDNECDLVTFYFSGHGIPDETTNEGYLAPYDYYPDDPFVSGINMEDLKKVIYTSKNIANTIIILDCCYAGIQIKGTKGILNLNSESKALYAVNLQNIISSIDKENSEVLYKKSVQGKIVLASSEPDVVSKEINNCIHGENDSPHSHGAFSYHLIEGLDGKAANADTGVITIENLRRYIEFTLMAEGKQQPIYSIAAASGGIENIKIAIAHNLFNAKIKQIINTVEDLVSVKYSNSDIVDMQNLAVAAKKVGELISLDPNNPEIQRLRKIIDNAIEPYIQSTMDWLSRNMLVARNAINQIEPNLFDYKLPDMIQSLSFNKLLIIDQTSLAMLIHLGAEIARNTQFKSEHDPLLRLFQAKLRATFRSGKGENQITWL